MPTSRDKGASLRIKADPKGTKKTVGMFEDGVLRKKVKGSKHRLRNLNAWAIDAGIVDGLGDTLKFIEVTDTETGMVYTVSATVFRGRRRMIDYGWGAQYALSIQHWEVTEA